MGIDWGNTATGALTGFAAGGPIGALIGGGAGLLSGLFGDKPQAPQFQNYQDPQMQGMIQSLMNQKLGQQQAQRTSALIGNQTKQAQEQFGENANFQGNAAVTSAFNSKIARTGEESMANANIQGAQVDQQAMTKAADLQAGQQQWNLQRNEFDQGVFKQNQQPSYIQNLFGQGLTGAVGSLIGRAGATNKTGGGSGPGGSLNFNTNNNGLNIGNPNQGYDWKALQGGGGGGSILDQG